LGVSDERISYGQENLILAGRCLAIAAGMSLVGALVAWFAGEDAHVDAVLVLVPLGIAFAAAAILVRDEVVSRRRTPRPMRSHYE
jgi:hypothetical protein